MRDNKTILVLGAAGMLGNAVLRYFAGRGKYHVIGSVRAPASVRLLPKELQGRVVAGCDVENPDSLERLFASTRPAAVINCVGIVKQLESANDPLQAIPINALLPHRLAQLASIAGARLIHMSTDCVFSGAKGMYKEADRSDAYDLYGRSKYLGEVDYPHAITLRTSIIGRELAGAHGLVDWFLSQNDRVKGYRRAIFSGLPTVELARVMHDYVLPHPALHGLYHVAADPIDKYSLLLEVANAYGKAIEVVPDDEVTIDRSLDSSRFRAETGYAPPAWPALVASMREFG